MQYNGVCNTSKTFVSPGSCCAIWLAQVKVKNLVLIDIMKNNNAAKRHKFDLMLQATSEYFA